MEAILNPILKEEGGNKETEEKQCSIQQNSGNSKDTGGYRIEIVDFNTQKNIWVTKSKEIFKKIWQD